MPEALSVNFAGLSAAMWLNAQALGFRPIPREGGCRMQRRSPLCYLKMQSSFYRCQCGAAAPQGELNDSKNVSWRGRPAGNGLGQR